MRCSCVARRRRRRCLAGKLSRPSRAPKRSVRQGQAHTLPVRSLAGKSPPSTRCTHSAAVRPRSCRPRMVCTRPPRDSSACRLGTPHSPIALAASLYDRVCQPGMLFERESSLGSRSQTAHVRGGEKHGGVSATQPPARTRHHVFDSSRSYLAWCGSGRGHAAPLPCRACPRTAGRRLGVVRLPQQASRARVWVVGIDGL